MKTTEGFSPRAFTDGACSGNPGPGGWGAIIVKGGGEVLEIGGADPKTTNNRMELRAAIEALKILDPSSSASVVSDSNYVILGATSWIVSWQRNGWKTANGGPVLNRDLWEELNSLGSRWKGRGLSWKFVRGHEGHAGNERADSIAVSFSQGKPLELYRGRLDGYPYGPLSIEPR